MPTSFPDFPALDKSYREIELESQGGRAMYTCIHCGDTRENETCIIRKQNQCADFGWNNKACQIMRDSSTKKDGD